MQWQQSRKYIMQYLKLSMELYSTVVKCAWDGNPSKDPFPRRVYGNSSRVTWAIGGWGWG